MYALVICGKSHNFPNNCGMYLSQCWMRRDVLLYCCHEYTIKTVESIGENYSFPGG